MIEATELSGVLYRDWRQGRMLEARKENVDWSILGQRPAASALWAILASLLDLQSLRCFEVNLCFPMYFDL